MATTSMSQGVADLARQVAIDQFAQDIDFNGKLAKKADLASPALTGTPTAPTANVGDRSDTIATTGFVRSAIDEYDVAVANGIYAAFTSFNADYGIS